MRLKKIILRNFRCYKEGTCIDVNDFTAFIGKNDIGKSTILEAMEIFFNEGIIKLDLQDACVYGDKKDVRIGCVFNDLPDEITIDANSKTSLRDEFLLNEDGDLEIHKVFNCTLQKPKGNFYAIAMHPSANSADDLLLLKRDGLKKRLKDLGIDEKEVEDLRSNPSIRKVIWQRSPDLKPVKKEIPLDKEDAKKIWESLSKFLPTFALFQSDRKSSDADDEVQDPMKLAITQAIRDVQDKLDDIKQAVQEKATEVAARTLEKLKEMDFNLAREMKPNFKAEPKWETLFKLSLTGDEQIPINKRGSGVRRLILLNFFRAEAERRQEEKNSPGVIYAIEEPETSQHPFNQKMIVEALLELSEKDNCQVLISTHVPGLAGLLPIETLRYIDRDDDSKTRLRSGEEIYELIAKELGVLPDKRIQVLVCVEGPNDIRFLRHISRMIHENENSIPDISDDPRIAIIPLGGSTLREWVQEHYLRTLQLPEVHIYDRDIDTPPKHQCICDEVNRRNDGSWATLTNKREIENYIHQEAIKQVYTAINNIELEYDENSDVPELVAKHIHEASESETCWDGLDGDKKDKKISKVKKRLCDEAASKMTYLHLEEIDSQGEIKSWLNQIGSRLN